MKAISVRQPWASMIIECGKDVENRSWTTKFRGTVLIHASSAKDMASFEAAFNLVEERNITLPVDWMFCEEGSSKIYSDWVDDCPRGGIIGAVDVVDCVAKSDSKWFMGKYGFMLSNARVLPFHPCKGSLGFFEVDYTLPS